MEGPGSDGASGVEVLPVVSLMRNYTGDQGTFGLIRPKEPSSLSFVSGELPWRDNRHDESCIPSGTYKCVWNHSAHFGREMYEVTGVPDRAGIRIHSANFMGDATKGFKKELDGCIAIGFQLGILEGQTATLGSRHATGAFEDAMGRKPFTLEIEGSPVDVKNAG